MLVEPVFWLPVINWQSNKQAGKQVWQATSFLTSECTQMLGEPSQLTTNTV